VSNGDLLTLAVVFLIAISCIFGLKILNLFRARRIDAQVSTLLSMFGPVIERSRSDPRIILSWHPIGEVARQTFPEAFATIEQKWVEKFPFNSAQIEAAHAQWTAKWLEWENDHNSDYQRKEESITAELNPEDRESSNEARARTDRLEQEKLQLYQRRYEEYVRISRGLAGLNSTES